DFTASGRVTGSVNGRGGVDTLSYQSRTTGVHVDLTAGTADSVGKLVSQIEDVQGSQGDDNLVGNGDDNHLVGNGGNDTLDGRGADDTLDGGADNDTLYDSRGNDTFIGGGGSDTLMGDATDNVFIIGGLANAGSLNGQSFDGVENLTGNSLSDTFTFEFGGQ